ncbi:agaA [Symbiodinium pilosum]|uniref:Alpha-galactosidase n=1 Tax=Symbiodinium pilosum TaxID=2952 RepID=A0A812RTI9_SYMPI|nr:agaA [Symbiodinium pilosum]
MKRGYLLACLRLQLSWGYDNGAPHSRLPPLGWSSWVGLGRQWPGPGGQAPEFDFCDEVSVKLSVDAFHEVGLYDAGYRHFHLDDCWADHERNASGFLQADRQHFPNGMKPIVDYAHSKGLTFGLYTCAGTYTCVGRRPGSKGHFTQDAAVFAEWGVDVVKMDWCFSDGMEPEPTYTAFSKALNATGHPIHFNMCEWGKAAPWTWGPKVAQSWRATGDHVPLWQDTKKVIAERSQIPEADAGRPYAWNDMDMLETGNYRQAAHANGKTGNMTKEEYRTEVSMWAILASPLIITTPLLNCSKTDQIAANFTPGTCRPSITPLQRELLLNKEVISINQVDTPGGRLLKDFGAWMVYIRNLAEGSVAVALYNPSDAKVDARLDLSLLGWTSGTVARVRDLWAQQELPPAKDRFPTTGSLDLEAHATLLFRFDKQTSELVV